jgi:hypothetical protein
MSTFTYRRRTFLASVSTGFTSYVFAEVESSCNGEYQEGNYLLTIADCHRSVDLEFFLGTSVARRQSLAKIDLLLSVLREFRDALLKESELIAAFNRKKPGNTKRKRSSVKKS